jgi:hypothetical protein
MKQTAVEWLKQQLETYGDPQYCELEWETLDDLVKQAKEMEKEQHGETFNQGVQWMQYQRDLVNGGIEYWDKKPSYFLEYYNETYGGNK